MEAFESFEHAGFVCELHQDEEPASPTEWDELGTMVALGRPEWRLIDADHSGQEGEAFERGGTAMLLRYLRTVLGQVVVPFRLDDYGSGGLVLTVATEHAERISGWIYTTRERCAELGAPWEDAERQLRNELENWRAFFAGEVYGYVVRDPGTGAVVDSVWGFYPDDVGDGLEELRAEARAAAVAERGSREARRRAVASGWASAHGCGAGVAA